LTHVGSQFGIAQIPLSILRPEIFVYKGEVPNQSTGSRINSRFLLELPKSVLIERAPSINPALGKLPMARFIETFAEKEFSFPIKN
jgi:hypothetical protein